jgi:hypothetical protein
MKTDYRGWPNCHRLTNGQVDLVATSDVGPRIIRFGFVGQANLFGEIEGEVGKVGGDTWRLYGGHRLWHSPEAKPRSYHPDNSSIRVEERPHGLTLAQDTESTTGIRKTLEVTLDPDADRATVVHQLRNDNLWPVELAAWALTVMARGGFAIIPQPPYLSHEDCLAPSRPIVQWPYTDMSDPRWRWGRQYITLRQDPKAPSPQKIGVANRENWAAYAVNGDLFIKLFAYVAGAAYPDFGCSVEVFTNSQMLELETLGPLTRLEPGQSLSYAEHWFLYRQVPVENSDPSINSLVLPRAQQALSWGRGS